MKRIVFGFLAVVMAGCGTSTLEPDEAPSATGAEALTVKGPVRQPFQLAGPKRTIAPQGPSAAVQLSGLTAGGEVYLVAGVMGCGFLELGRATFTAGGASGSVQLPLSQQAGYGGEVYAFIDADGDGECTTETVYSGFLTGSAAAIDFSQPGTGDAGCWIFRR